MLQEGIRDHVFNHDSVRQFDPQPAVDLHPAEFAFGEFVAPFLETAFGELHNITLVHQGHRWAAIVDSVLDRFANQTLAAFDRNRFDANGRGFGKANFFHAHFLLQEGNHPLHFRRAGFPLHPSVNILGVLAKDHHVGFFRLFHRTGHTGEITHRAQAHIEIEHLAQGHIERTHAAGSRRRERALDRHHILAHRLHGFVRQPAIGAIHARCFLAGIDFHPRDLALATIGFRHCGIDHLTHHRRNIHARAIALDKGNNRVHRHLERVVGVYLNLLAANRNFNMLIHHDSLKTKK